MNEVIDRPLIADRLRELVEQDGRSQKVIAAAAGIHWSYLSQIVTGVRPNPTMKTVDRLLLALGRSWADLDESGKSIT